MWKLFFKFDLWLFFCRSVHPSLLLSCHHVPLKPLCSLFVLLHCLLSFLTLIYIFLLPSSPVNPPTIFFPPLVFSTLLPSPLPPGWRRNPGDQRREHQRYEARSGHRAHQEWRPPSPSGAQEGWRLCAWIWWVNLRKHSLLTHLHTLSQGAPSRWWWVEGARTKNHESWIHSHSPDLRKRKSESGDFWGFGSLCGGGHS